MGTNMRTHPRMQELIRRANKIRENLPPTETGFVRLWRGNRVGEVGQNPSFTNSLEGITLPFLDAYRGSLNYVDVAENDLNTYLDTSAVAENSEFTLSPELAAQAKIVS